MKRIIYTLQDGRLAVCVPTLNTYPTKEYFTDDEITDRSFSKLPKDAIDPRIVDDSEIPSDRTFRDAWKATGGGIEVDMPKARGIARRFTINPSKELEIDAAQTPEELKAIITKVEDKVFGAETINPK